MHYGTSGKKIVESINITTSIDIPGKISTYKNFDMEEPKIEKYDRSLPYLERLELMKTTYEIFIYVEKEIIPSLFTISYEEDMKIRKTLQSDEQFQKFRKKFGIDD